MNNSFTKMLAATAIALLSAASPVHAAALSYFSSSTQLDSDAIDDIAANVGDQLPVTLQLDTTGLTNSLQSFTFVLTRDTSALSLVSSVVTPQGLLFFPEPTLTRDDSNPPFTIATLEYNSTTGGLTPNSQLNFREIVFNVEPGISNDGTADFDIILTSAVDTAGTDVTSLFTNTGGSFDVQAVPEPASTLGLLALGAMGAGSVLKKKLKK